MIQLLMFDAKGETFRDEMFGQYKSHFPPPDERQKIAFGLLQDRDLQYGAPPIAQASTLVPIFPRINQ